MLLGVVILVPNTLKIKDKKIKFKSDFYKGGNEPIFLEINVIHLEVRQNRINQVNQD